MTGVETFVPGQRVSHAEHGEGVVVDPERNGYVRAFFAGGERLVAVAALQPAGDRQVAPAGRLEVGRGEYRQHARHLLRGADVERFDLRMRILRAQHDAVRHARQLDFVDIAAAALQQTRILEPRHALSDGEFTHWSCLLYS